MPVRPGVGELCGRCRISARTAPCRAAGRRFPRRSRPCPRSPRARERGELTAARRQRGRSRAARSRLWRRAGSTVASLTRLPAGRTEPSASRTRRTAPAELLQLLLHGGRVRVVRGELEEALVGGDRGREVARLLRRLCELELHARDRSAAARRACLYASTAPRGGRLRLADEQACTFALASALIACADRVVEHRSGRRR